MSKFIPHQPSTKPPNLSTTKTTPPKPSDQKSFSKNPFQVKPPHVTVPHSIQRICLSKSPATPAETQLLTQKMSSHGQIRSEVRNEMEKIDRKFGERFSEIQTLKQSNFWKQFGSGVGNAADELIFQTNFSWEIRSRACDNKSAEQEVAD
jgi:hypothetical protein